MIVYVCGVPRAGKTTFVKKLRKKLVGANLIVSEALRNGLQKIEFKPWGTRTSPERQNLFPAVAKEFLEWNESFSESDVIFDCALIPLKKVFVMKRDCDKVICLGFGGITSDEILKLIREHEHGQYTEQFSDEKLLAIWGNIEQEDKDNLKFCQENNILYINSSKNREKVLDELINKF